MSNCYICGRFVGKDGNHDVYYDGYNGGYEQGYPTCRKHTKRPKRIQDGQTEERKLGDI